MKQAKRPRKKSVARQSSANQSERRKAPSLPPRPQFRLGGLDGLRAIAAVAVVLYHAWPTVLPGGFLGVDVFFALSGFLITGLLVKEKSRHGQISLRRFWLRRVRRLFPAVALLTVVMVPLAALVNIDLVAGIRTQVLGTLTFTHNWVMIISDASYFESRIPQLLTNMWTLAVEQQFYLLWPLVLLFLPLRRRAFVFLPIVLAVLSALEMAYLSWGVDDPSRAYMGTDSHGFGLMAGAALALWLGRVVEPSERQVSASQAQLRGVVSWSGMALILLLCFVADDEAPVTYPWVTLFATFATGAVIQGFVAPVQNVPGPAVTLRKILDLRPLVWLGERSYGVYLWHWPMLVIFWYLFPGLSEAWMFFLVLPLSVVCAALSFRFVEAPMRFGGILATLGTWLGVDLQVRPIAEGVQAASGAGQTAAGQTAVKGAKAKQGAKGTKAKQGAKDKIVPAKAGSAPTKAKNVSAGGAVTGDSMPPDKPRPFLELRRAILAALPICLVLACALAPAYSELSQAQEQTDSADSAAAATAQSPAPSASTPSPQVPSPQAPNPQAPSTQTPDAQTPNPQAPSEPSNPDAPAAQVPGSEVTFIGDSVTQMAAQSLSKRWPDMIVDGKKNRAVPQVPTLIKQYAEQGKLRRVVIVAVANNSTMRLHHVESWLEQIGPNRILVLVTGHGRSADKYIWDSNQVIREAAKKYPQRIVLAPFDEVIKGHEGDLYRDQVHPRPQGEKFYIQTVEQALRAAAQLQK